MDPENWDGDMQADCNVAEEIEPLNLAYFDSRGSFSSLTIRLVSLSQKNLPWPPLRQIVLQGNLEDCRILSREIIKLVF